MILIITWAAGQEAGPEVGTSPPPRHVPQDTGVVYVPVRSIPYPGRTMYVAHGILGSIGFGKHQGSSDTGSLFQWQGEVTYFYTPWFSGGAEGKILAGEPNSKSQSVKNRYTVIARFHAAGGRFAGFVGPNVGIDNLNFFQRSDTTPREPFKRTRMGLGLEAGGGWKPIRWAGAGAGSQLEYTVAGDLTYRLLGSVSLDIVSLFTGLRQEVSGLYLSLEYQRGALLAGQGPGPDRNAQESSVVVGLCLGF